MNVALQAAHLFFCFRVEVFSTNYRRTQLSAQGFLDGFLRGAAGVPVVVRPRAEDFLNQWESRGHEMYEVCVCILGLFLRFFAFFCGFCVFSRGGVYLISSLLGAVRASTSRGSQSRWWCASLPPRLLRLHGIAAFLLVHGANETSTSV